MSLPCLKTSLIIQDEKEKATEKLGQDKRGGKKDQLPKMSEQI
jgi:hypothetical protein